MADTVREAAQALVADMITSSGRCGTCEALDPMHREGCRLVALRAALAGVPAGPQATPPTLDGEADELHLSLYDDLVREQRRVVALEAVVRKLHEGWTPETDDDPPIWYLESGHGDVNLQWDGTAPMSPDEHAVLVRVVAVPTDHEDQPDG